MQYITVFDISDQPATNRNFLIIAVILVISTLLWFIFSDSPIGRYSFLTFTVLFIAFTIAVPYWDHHRLAQKLTSSDYQVVEGFTTGYWRKDWYEPTDRTDYSYEAFQVGAVQFGYHRFVEMAGFHNDEATYFPMRNGLWVRIYYIPEEQIDEGNLINRILRLEVKQPSKQPQPLSALR